MHSLLHDIPLFFILFLEELFLIFNQMLNIRAFGGRASDTRKVKTLKPDIFLSVTSHINCIVARCLINIVYLTVCAFIRS